MGKKILIVDDDVLLCEVLKTFLSAAYEVAVTHDGEAGLAMMRQAVPDLALVDICMPRMHGFELCQKLRADERLKAVKVLFISSKSYAHDIETAKKIGVDDYLVKPFKSEELLEKVRQLIGG